MTASLDGPFQGLTPSSAGMPLQPFTPPGTLMVPFDQVNAFLSSFPTPPGLRQAGQLAMGVLQNAAGQFGSAVKSGDMERVLKAIVKQAVRTAPDLLTGAGALITGSGVLAGLLGPASAAIPYVGPVVAGGLEVYAPLASIGGQTVAIAGAAAQAVNQAANFAQAQANQAAQPS